MSILFDQNFIFWPNTCIGTDYALQRNNGNRIQKIQK